jgi:hypothetical protein
MVSSHSFPSLSSDLHSDVGSIGYALEDSGSPEKVCARTFHPYTEHHYLLGFDWLIRTAVLLGRGIQCYYLHFLNEGKSGISSALSMSVVWLSKKRPVPPKIWWCVLQDGLTAECPFTRSHPFPKC